jgi:[ribosomal protein S5]-alanine N-acetyltransferase
MLNKIGSKELETDRLILRKYVIEDVREAFELLNDEEVCKYLRFKPLTNIDEEHEKLLKVIKNYDDLSYFRWAVINKANNSLIGNACLGIINENDLCGTIAYVIKRQYWGCGYATEMINKVLEYAFDEIGFNRIEAYHSVNNPNSGRVMEKCGMIFEGVAKQKYKSPILGFQDSNMYGIIKDEYMKHNSIL